MRGNGWEHNRSTMTEREKDGLKQYMGSYIYNEHEFRYALNEQRRGKYRFRGKVSAVSPEDGKILQLTGKKREEKLKQMGEKGQELAEKGRCRECSVCTEIYTNNSDQKAIRDCVEKGAARLYSENIWLMRGKLRKSNRPDTITPGIAAELYAEQFVRKTNGSSSEKTQENQISILKTNYTRMRDVPMSEYKQAYIVELYKEVNLTKSKKKLMEKFWRFLLDNGYCKGINPFPPQEKKHTSYQALQIKARNADRLGLDQNDRLYALLSDSPNGGDCGVALMCWGRIPASRQLCWKDILFDDKDETLARVIDFKPDLSGATHNYTRPVFPQAALILRKRYENLLQKYSEDELGSMPVASQAKDEKKPMKPNALIQYAGMLLRKIGVSEEVFAYLKQAKNAVATQILFNTYDSLLGTCCGLENDMATIRFLQGKPLGDVTSDHYTSFTDPEAVNRIHTAQLAIQPMRKISEEKEGINTEEEVHNLSFSPQHTRSVVTATVMLRVPPGGDIAIQCPHGVTVSVKSREVCDGKVKRKMTAHAHL